ncbi:hypothetical protein GCM10020229_32860 [Kitasatospora albolonga]|uniref:hypothetical protein n=1 Tax=Kitasatospora albolonga TaxID=68173 RepID=UPI0031EB9751
MTGADRATHRAVRRRVHLLVLVLLLTGLPWTQRALPAPDADNPVLRWLLYQLRFPAWLSDQDLVGTVFRLSETDGRIISTTSTAVLLLALLWWTPRLVPIGQGRGRLLAGCVGTATLATVLASLAHWAALFLVLRGSELSSAGVDLLFPVSADFGLLLAGALALALSGLGTDPLGHPSTARRPGLGPGRRTRPATPPSERSSAMSVPHATGVPLGSEPGDVTRYLSAAVYTDPAFARLVTEELVADELGAVAASPGVDLVPVARHALAAQALRRRRDGALALAFLALLLVSPLWLLLTGLVLAVLGAAARNGRYDRSEGSERGRREGVTPRALVLLLLTVPVAAAVPAAALALLAAYEPPGFWAWLTGGYLAGVPALLAMGGGLAAAQLLTLRHVRDVDARLRGQLHREAFRPDAPVEPLGPDWTGERLLAIARAQQGNVTVHSSYLPFLGYGPALATVPPIVVPLLPAGGLPGGQPSAIREFDAWELITAVRDRLRETSDRHSAEPPGGAEADLAGLRLEHRVSVHGTVAADDPRLLPADLLHPVTRLSEEQVREITLDPDGRARHHLVAHLPLWGDDVVPSHFLRVSISGRTLHLDSALHVLRPVLAAHHEVDLLPRELSGARLDALRLAALGQAPTLLRRAPSAYLDLAGYDRRHRNRLRRGLLALEHDPAFDHGARLSVREAAAGPGFPNHYQESDCVHTALALFQHALTAVRDFLDEHGVDTGPLTAQQQNNLVNFGVIQQGGISQVGNQAVGPGALAQSSPAPAAPSVQQPRSQR